MIPKTSIKHLIAIPIGIVYFIIMSVTKFEFWTNTSFNDEDLGIYLPNIVFQIVASTIIGFILATLFEYLQQREAKRQAKIKGLVYEAASAEDTKADILVTGIGFFLGVVIGWLIVLVTKI